MAEAPDPRRISHYLRSLGVANRIELLRILQVPKTVGEINLTPVRQDRSRSPTRAISRQAVESHLRALRALGLVQERPGTRGGRRVREYVVNQARVFVLTEEIRELAFLRPIAGATAAEAHGRRPLPPQPGGPSLFLVGGPLEGTAFPLHGAGPWVIGRDRAAEVALRYDPFVSTENTRLLRRGSGFAVEALPGAKNGTQVNWRALAPGEVSPLAPGDVVGVGRSLLLFRGG